MSRCPRHLPATRSTGALVLLEPFRLFFPWALLVGMAGVALWPLFLTGHLGMYPGQAHARIMIEGMLGAFALGFLSTAAPRMLESAPLAPSLVVGCWIMHAAAVGAHLTNRVPLGDGLFSALWLGWLGMMLWKAVTQRRDAPPAGMIAVLAGVVCGIAGAGALAWRLDETGSWMAYRLPRLLLYQGFLLLPVLGIGAFLFPRISGLAGRKSRALRWVMLAATVGVVSTFMLEVRGWPRTALWARAVLVAATLGWCVPGLWWRRLAGTQAWALRLGLACIVASFPLLALWPGYGLGLSHMLFLSGFGLVTLTVAARVTDGHSGHRAEAQGRSRWLQWIVWLALLTMATRVSADVWPQVQRSHFIYAAALWIVIGGLWIAGWGRKLTLRDPEDSPEGNPVPPSS